MLFEVEGWGLEKKKVKKSVGKKRRFRESEEEVTDEASKLGLAVPKQKKEKKEKKDKKDKKDRKERVELEEKVEAGGKTRPGPGSNSSKEEVVEERPSKRVQTLPPAYGDDIDASKLTPLQRKMLNKLSGSRFRWINEQLYTTDSKSALEMIQRQPELYEEYHKGFASQVESWPENPVDVLTRKLVYKGVQKMTNAPGGLLGVDDHGGKTVVVADMGCGEAALAINVDNFMQEYKRDGQNALKKFKKKFGHGGEVNLKNRKLAIKVHSFDLKKINDKITVADIKNVPLPNASVTVAIFCLSLMGTNFLDFIAEAERILVPNGELWITEIKSRLVDSNGGTFVNAIEGLGFKLRSKDDKNKMFTQFEFYKSDKKKAKFESRSHARGESTESEWLLKPCIYKRR
ncbi:uncharacterized protein C5L36_0E02480 [Pichia kudriavzevii]|uniref:Ribosomal RNA-processing protein 8 n=2 Tax=Pichia kudriavzevii TaxID=4909 RepID=A0A2U9R9R0_PICKU|nr:uncharacterized protein C5L36_0E02480 [Pichia kudriavzevii]AWU78184.1 hypothetical protein C5L36_0E02480 [Pichia kudriavzevii]